MTDREFTLIERARGGAGQAFAELYAPYEGRLRKVALRLTGNREDAADVLQVALLRAYVQLGRFGASRASVPGSSGC